MEDLWGRYGFRGLAFVLLALFSLLRIFQLFSQHKQLKRDGLRGNYIAQAVVGIACSAGALAFCEPRLFGLQGGEEKPSTGTPTAAVTSDGKTAKKVALPPNVHFTGPLAPAKEAIEDEDWATLARIIFDIRKVKGSDDINFLLSWKAKPLGKVYLERGRAALDAGDASLAKANLEYAIQLLSEESEPWLLHARSLPPEEWKAALEELEQASKRDPKDPRPAEKRLEILRAHGEKKKLLPELDRLIAFRPGDAHLWAERGRLRLELGYEGAIADLASARAALPGDAALRLDLARARLRLEDKAQWKLALADLDGLLRQSPDDVKALVVRGQARFKLDNFPEAIADYSHALTQDPKCADALAGRGRVEIQREQNVQALKDFDEALKLDPKTRLALVWRGYLRRNSDPKAGLEDLQRAIEIDSDVDALLYKGECLVNLHRRDEAEAALSDALLLTRDQTLVDRINAQLVRARSMRH